jgi:hypothetical protein
MSQPILTSRGSKGVSRALLEPFPLTDRYRLAAWLLDTSIRLHAQESITRPPVATPAPGLYLGPQTVSLSDATPGAPIYYTVDNTTPTAASAKYAGPIQVGSSETIRAIAVASGDQASAVSSATYTISAPTQLKLTPKANNYAIAADGSVPLNGGFDHGGHSYSANRLGSSITWHGQTFTFGAPGIANAVGNRTIPVPAGNYGSVTILAAAVNGNQPNQTFIVGPNLFTQGVSDWHTSHLYPGESLVKTMPYRVNTNGGRQSGPVYIYAYTFPLESYSAVSSIILPSNGNVVVLAVNFSAAQVDNSGGFPSAQGLTLVGNASIKDNALILTDGGLSDFEITPAGASTGGGFTFTIQNAGAGVVGAFGSGLGYAGISSSVAIKFDLYNNAGEGTESTGIYINGASPTVPSIDMTGKVNLHSADPMHAHITYDGTTLRVTIEDALTGASFSTSQAIDIPASVGHNRFYGADYALVGFTAGTGGATSTQQI